MLGWRLGRLWRLGLHEDGENTGRIFRGYGSAAIGRGDAVAPNEVDAEGGRARMRFTSGTPGHADLQQGEIGQGVWQPGAAAIVSGDLLMPHLQMKVSLIISGEQAHAGVRDWMTIDSVENADNDRVVVNDWKVLIGATDLSRVKKKRRREKKCEREKSELRPEGQMRWFTNLPMVVNPRHACSVRACARTGARKVGGRSRLCRLRKESAGVDRDGKVSGLKRSLRDKAPELQILRLTTPKLRPANEDLFAGTPERRLGPRSLRMTNCS